MRTLNPVFVGELDYHSKTAIPRVGDNENLNFTITERILSC